MIRIGFDHDSPMWHIKPSLFFCIIFPFMIQVGDCLGTLIKTYKASFLPFFDELSSYLMPMWVSHFLLTVNYLYLIFLNVAISSSI